MRTLGLLALGACATAPVPDPALLAVPQAAQQAVVVRAEPAAPTQARAQAFARHGDGWQPVGPSIAAVVGRSGIVAGAAKREGDGGTPAGVHRFGTAFGTAAACATGLAYRPTTARDHWVDDPASPLYNRWVDGDPGVSCERLRREDHQYDLAAVLEWNTAPVVPGRGSAIFVHLWRVPGEPTAGCVAMARPDLERLLAWLDVAAAPVCVVVEPSR